MRTFLLLTIISLLAISCENQNAQAILGSWNCSRILEEGEPIALDVSAINFTFDEADNYTYQANLKYREAGTYRLVGDKLYTRDTLDKNAVEKVVKIILLTSDSMHFKMNDGGKERIMKLSK